jgi:hypothetical protein
VPIHRRALLGAPAVLLGAHPRAARAAAPLAWPAGWEACGPWSYWWWMGSAVTKPELERHLALYRAAGLAGVHVIPIYGAKGHERGYVPFLSPAWIDLLGHVVTAARAQGLGVDVTTGTGWPFGGPQVAPVHAGRRAFIERHVVAGGARLEAPLVARAQPEAPLVAVVAAPAAVAARGEAIDLTALVDDRRVLSWTAPPEGARVYALYAGWTGQKVKRAAPGGEGAVLDHFSEEALRAYLARFDAAWAGLAARPRAVYNDSYEAFGADWTPRLLEEFSRRRGYELRARLPALHGDGDPDVVARVRHDFRETISDLLLEGFTRPWTAWARGKGLLTRNEAHGAPANLLDLYAAADVPESEAFGPSGFPIPGLRTEQNLPAKFGKPDPLFVKLASSAAHVAGRPLVSAESCTWLAEHFQVAPSQVKPELDALFAAGVNHVFFHGLTYSPADAPWPGWLFYASTDFGPANPWWSFLPDLSAYVARCQAILRAGRPDEELLVYFPFHDLWQSGAGRDGRPPGKLRAFEAHHTGEWLHGADAGIGATARALAARGQGFDYVSDRGLAGLAVDGGGLRAPGGTYRAALVPRCRVMPLATLETLVALARGGATILVEGELPPDVEGWGALDERRARRRAIVAGLGTPRRQGGIAAYGVGAGRLLVGPLEGLLSRARLRPEPAAAAGLRVLRRAHDDGHALFLANLGARAFDGWLPLGAPARAAGALDPRTGAAGRLALRRARGRAEVRLQLDPGESLVVRTLTSGGIAGGAWPIFAPAGAPIPLEGRWTIAFLDGGPAPPPAIETERLASFTELGGEAARAFAGTARYTLRFAAPTLRADEWRLELGAVHEAARVRLNGGPATPLWCLPFRTLVGRQLRPGENLLEIEVANLPANRVSAMAREARPGARWAHFHDIDFVDIQYRPFDASAWPPLPSGLLGPVRLVPLRRA